MQQDEFVVELSRRFGISATRQTVARYESIGLISAANRVGRGNRPGRVAEYETKALFEYVASYKLITGTYYNATLSVLLEGGRLPKLSAKIVALARKEALRRCELNTKKQAFDIRAATKITDGHLKQREEFASIDSIIEMERAIAGLDDPVASSFIDFAVAAWWFEKLAAEQNL
mgnify:CR=1 FL=1